MSAPIDLLSVFADVVILLALGMAVTSPGLSRLARSVLATLVFACAWVATAASDAMRAPGWLIVLGGAVMVVSIVVVTATLHLWTQEGDDGGAGGPGRRGARGGGGPRGRRPDAPQQGGGGSDPGWWPEFERQLALYAAERERVCPPAHDLCAGH